MKVLVCGGRNFTNWLSVHNELRPYLIKSEINDGDHSTYTLEIISGMARGADTIAAKYAEQYNLRLHKFPANWDKYGKAAGSIRNQQMIDECYPDLVLAFPGGRGTADMIKRAKFNNIKVKEVTI